MNKKTSFLCRSVLGGWLCWICFVDLAGAQPEFEPTRETIIETHDGLILAGTVKGVSQECVGLESAYGILTIPLHQIRRVDGDRFDPIQGVMREQEITLEPDGDVRFDTLIPLPPRTESNEVSLLLPGTPIQVKDLNGVSLSFVSREVAGLFRCTIQLPETRLSAVQVRVLQKKAVRVEGGERIFEFRYMPRCTQMFYLRVTLPTGARLLEATPEAVNEATQTFSWRMPLQRQESAKFDVTYQLNP